MNKLIIYINNISDFLIPVNNTWINPYIDNDIRGYVTYTTLLNEELTNVFNYNQTKKYRISQ